jgi:hypothetical protein
VKRDDAEEYTEALGQVVAGGWRQVALGERLGVPAALGLTTREWVEQRLGGYVRLGIAERREAAGELVADGMTQRQVADVLGVSAATVNGDVQNRTPRRDEAAVELDDGPAPVQNRTPREPDPRATARDVTLSIADAIRYLDRPLEHAPAVAEMFDPDDAGIGRENWTPDRFERAGAFLEALTTAINGGHR